MEEELKQKEPQTSFGSSTSTERQKPAEPEFVKRTWSKAINFGWVMFSRKKNKTTIQINKILKKINLINL